MAIIEERTKEINELYAEATTEEGYDRVWDFFQKSLEEFRGQPINIRARFALNAYWARYYKVREFAWTKNNIDNLYGVVKQYLAAFEKREVELVVNYKYLLSVVAGELRKDPQEAEKLIKEIDQLVRGTDNIPLALKVINAQGLHAMRLKDWQEAIKIFTKAEQRFPEAPSIPEARQHLGNTVNNRGLSKLHLSDGVRELEAKKEMIRSGVRDLLAAMNLYLMAPLIPQKHLEGIRNRLRLAKDKAEEIDSDLVQEIEVFIQ